MANYASLTEATAQVIRMAGSQHAVAAEALGEYTSIAQSGGTSAQKQVRSLEIGVHEVAQRKKGKAQAAFTSWVKDKLEATRGSFNTLFKSMFYMAGLDAEGLHGQQALAAAIRELNQALGALSHDAQNAFQVDDNHNVKVNRAKAHYIQGGAGVYVDGGPAVVMSAVAATLRAHGFTIEADIVGVIGHSESHRLANAYTLDARKLFMKLRDSSRIEAPKIEILTPYGSVTASATGLELHQGTSAITLGPSGILLKGPTIQLEGLVSAPGGYLGITPLVSAHPELNAATQSVATAREVLDAAKLAQPAADLAVPGSGTAALAAAQAAYTAAIEAAAEALSGLFALLPSGGAKPNPLVEAGVTPIAANKPRVGQKAIPQWKGHLPQPWV